MNSDQRLQDSVHRELAEDQLVDDSQLEVEVADGVVTLIGTVGSYAEKMLAQGAAQATSGVHDIVNVIDVKPPEHGEPSEMQLQIMVERVLAWSALVPEQGIEVSVVDGLVALTGSCATETQATEAERSISHLVGVRDVLNRIEVSPPRLSPAEVHAAIALTLSRRAVHRAAQIDVTVDGGIVALTGVVQSSSERRAIVEAVRRSRGIDEVQDQLQIGAER